MLEVDLSSTSFCRERPDALSVTDTDKFSVDQNESPVDVLDPASPLSLNDSCISVLTTDYSVDVSVKPTPLIRLILSGGFQLFCTSSALCKAVLIVWTFTFL